MDVTISELIKRFVQSPLVTWVKTFGPVGEGNSEDSLAMYMDLVDGVFLNKIMLQIDPRATSQRVNKNINNDVNLRIQNLTILVKHMKSYYQENLQQLIIMNLPDVLMIGRDPLSDKSMEEMNKLLLLMLGCAVQCSRKEEFIERIKQLDIETQASIVTHIQRVTHDQENVFDLQLLEHPDMTLDELETLSRSMAVHLKRLIDERDEFCEVIVDLTQERDYLQSQSPPSPVKSSSPEKTQNSTVNLSKEDKQHLGVELADTKAKLRRIRQDLEEKSEQLIDVRHELDQLQTELQKLKQENMQLSADARLVRAYRDELDSLREKASRVDRLEAELARCKEKLHDVEFYKARMEELREDNIILIETKAMLEEQLSGARSRSDKLHDLEKENLQLKSKLHDFEIDRDADKKRIEELLEENMVLEIAQKQSMNESAQLGWELEQLSKSTDLSDVRKSFVFEMNESASSRILKLEKENQSLQSTIQELRDVSLTMEGSNLRVQELEKENQQLHKQIEAVQFQLEQEKQTCQGMEMLSEELLKDKEQLKEIIENVRAEKERQIKELELENNHLNQTVTSLRQRSQISTEAKIKDIEKENKSLHEAVRETSSKLSKVEFDKKQMQKELSHLTEKLEKAEEQEKTVTELERENEMLHKKVATLSIICEKVEVVEQENSTLELEYRRLKKAFDSLQNATIKLEALEKDNKELDEENLELRRMVETLKFASKKMTQVELENKELEQEKEELQKEVEELKTRSKKYERLELSYQGVELENQRLQQTVENCSRKIQQLEKDSQETKAERQVLQQRLEELLICSSRAETLEKDNRVLKQEVGQLEKDKKSLEKETKRLWQQVESKDAALDDNSLKLDALEKENKTLEKEMLRFRESYSKVKELEKDNKELLQKTAVDEQMLTELREELVLEKLKIQQMCCDREKMNLELEKIGLNVELLLHDEQNHDEKKYRVLETKNEMALKKKLESKEGQIAELETQVQEFFSINQQLRKELDGVKSDFEAVKQKQAEERSVQNSVMASIEKLQPVQQMKEKWELEHRETTMELLKVKDRVIDLERNNAALHAEKQLLKDQLRQLENQNSSLNNQILALQTNTSSLHEHNSALQTQTAKLQVENSTLSSQSASLLAQNALLQRQQVTMENEMDVLLKRNEEMRTTHDLLLQDHERLVTLHEHQSTEYEALISQYSTLKTLHRTMELERRELEERFEHLKMEKVEWEAMEKVLKAEHEKMHLEKQKGTVLLSENKKLQEELQRANIRQSQLKEEYDGLQIHTKDLKTSLNTAQLELNRWQTRYDELKDQHQSMDITLTKLDNHCELLTRLKGNLEEENHHLMSQIQMLNQQNHALLEQTMESKELYHEEQKQYIDKLNTLRRQKEKLEEKIMDQYKFYDPVPKKKNHWVGAKALVKLIKPKKDSNKERSKSSSDTQPLQPETTDVAAASSAAPTTSSSSAVATTSAAQLALPSHPPKPQHEGADNGSAAQNAIEDNHIASVSKAMNDLGHRQRELSRSTGNNDSLELSEDAPLRHRLIQRTSKAYSTSNIHLSASVPTPSSASRQQNRPKGFKSNDDLLEQAYETDFPDTGHIVPGIRPNSTENNRTASNNSSPLSPKGSSDHIPGRSESLSSDDLVPSRDMAVVSKDGYLYRSSSAYVIAASSGRQAQSHSQNGFVPYDLPQKSSPVPHWTQKQARASSPGSEMVTLQEFLEESNRLSPPSEKLNPRDDLLGDYFRKINDPPAIRNQLLQSVRRENPKMTSSFVSPVVKASFESTEERAAKPGQHVPSSSRHTEIPCRQNVASSGRSAPMQQNRPLSAFSATKQMQQMQPPSNVGSKDTSLSRAFSLASTDLLRVNGPDDNIQELPQKPPPDISGGKDTRDPSWRPSTQSGIPVTMRERPQSARVSGTSGQGTDLRSRTWDPRRLSHTAPLDERKLPLHQHSVSSFSLNSSNSQQQDRLGPPSGQQLYSSTQLPVSRMRMRPPSRSGEVAMVSPGRAAPDYSGDEGARMQNVTDVQISKTQTRPAEGSPATPGIEDVNRSSPSAAKNASESPDSSTEQQTVWYEYGCV